MRKKIIFIGNSIVAGYPWSKGKSFVSVFRKGLKDLPLSPSVGFDVINKGINGDTTAGILGRFSEDVLDASPDIVFIMTGTNDFIYRDSTPSEAFANLEQMAQLCDRSEIIPVFMTPLPVDEAKAEAMWLAGLGISYAAVNRQLDEFSNLIRSSGRFYVDTGRKFADYAAGFEDSDLVYLDGLHPMPDGHAFIAECIREFMTTHKEGLY
ncbi:MAG: GDSL-type esterase/lipase family protein [Firmicutes bacterium]|nr:GDSL-type esterase/lipase family protein [Bacillota bacterium]